MIETTAAFVAERQQTYRRFVVWGGVFLLHCVAIVALLALFRS